MKTKVVQHVPRINLSHFNFLISNLNFQIFKISKFQIFSGSQLLSDFQTFFIFRFPFAISIFIFHFNFPFSPCSRYKSPSPASQLQETLGQTKNSMRRRVQSPNRRDFKDFSSHSNRDFRSPQRTNSRFTDEDEDSGADSLNDLMSCHSAGGHSCRSCPSHLPASHGPPSHHHSSQHMALVPYDAGHGCRACFPHESCCCPQAPYMYSPQNMQVALPAAIEERLLVLEGDKDQLHLQVSAREPFI